MQISPASVTSPLPPATVDPGATSPSPWSGQVLGSLEFVRRAPDKSTITASIGIEVFPDRARPVAGGFVEAVRAAQGAAKVPIADGIHALPLSQAHGVLQAADGVFWIAPLGGDHRGFKGPLFIDGEMGRRVALTVFGSRSDRALQAVVGEEQAIDLRITRSAGLQSIDGLIARELAHPRGSGVRIPKPDSSVPALPLPGGGTRDQEPQTGWHG